ncbi:hypothetical protein GGF32_001268 [Allomyces javanicus]|nr:hypothetical protein GGF32_001268 [Allomyces javanicus]
MASPPAPASTSAAAAASSSTSTDATNVDNACTGLPLRGPAQMAAAWRSAPAWGRLPSSDRDAFDRNVLAAPASDQIAVRGCIALVYGAAGASVSGPSLVASVQVNSLVARAAPGPGSDTVAWLCTDGTVVAQVDPPCLMPCPALLSARDSVSVPNGGWINSNTASRAASIHNDTLAHSYGAVMGCFSASQCSSLSWNAAGTALQRNLCTTASAATNGSTTISQTVPTITAPVPTPHATAAESMAGSSLSVAGWVLALLIAVPVGLVGAGIVGFYLWRRQRRNWKRANENLKLLETMQQVQDSGSSGVWPPPHPYPSTLGGQGTLSRSFVGTITGTIGRGASIEPIPSPRIMQNLPGTDYTDATEPIPVVRPVPTAAITAAARKPSQRSLASLRRRLAFLDRTGKLGDDVEHQATTTRLGPNVSLAGCAVTLATFGLHAPPSTARRDDDPQIQAAKDDWSALYLDLSDVAARVVTATPAQRLDELWSVVVDAARQVTPPPATLDRSGVARRGTPPTSVHPVRRHRAVVMHCLALLVRRFVDALVDSRLLGLWQQCAGDANGNEADPVTTPKPRQLGAFFRVVHAAIRDLDASELRLPQLSELAATSQESLVATLVAAPADDTTSTDTHANPFVPVCRAAARAFLADWAALRLNQTAALPGRPSGTSNTARPTTPPVDWSATLLAIAQRWFRLKAHTPFGAVVVPQPGATVHPAVMLDECLDRDERPGAGVVAFSVFPALVDVGSGSVLAKARVWVVPESVRVDG